MVSAPAPNAEEIVTYTSGDLSRVPDLRLLHYNDGEADL